jgi:hypothetical protein
MSRFAREKRAFFDNDGAARYLSDLIAEPFLPSEPPARGSFGWVVRELDPDDLASLALGLVLAAALDGSMGSVIAACMNDAAKMQPSLALIQRLWDRPEEVLALADPLHPLFRCGLLRAGVRGGVHPGEIDWDASLTVPSLVARQLSAPDAPLPHGLARIAIDGGREDRLDESMRVVATRLGVRSGGMLRIVPVLGPRWSDHRGVVRAVARAVDAEVIEQVSDAPAHDDQGYLDALATVCWLRGVHLFLKRDDARHGEQHAVIPSPTIPATLFLALSDRRDLAGIPQRLLLPIIEVPPFTYHDRVAHWKRQLGTRADGLDQVIAEVSRRFRYDPAVIDRIGEGLRRLPPPLAGEDLIDACRAELDLDLGELAGRVHPRFGHGELVLPHKQRMQFEEQLKAMRSLTEVHYNWGTARAWGESGISILFAGPPGTGKTMAAEVIAVELGLPMYRIDLSQVVNKYIGETEKNLKKVFDAADVADMILFFDEADSLFGKRTEVSDSKDRYANLEVSYLLERMERFKGLAILATNRKKDLDEAFLRRLRYIIDSPLPDVAERRRIWRGMIPRNVDATALDFDYLAERFQIAGGNIRSVVFNACLQCADGSTLDGSETPGRLTMEQVVIALKREFDKMGRTLSLEQFGAYAGLVRRLEHES